MTPPTVEELLIFIDEYGDQCWNDGRAYTGPDQKQSDSTASSRAQVVKQLEAAFAAFEVKGEQDHPTAELDLYKRASAFCDKHRPNGGWRGVCLVCAGEKLTAALSRISYLCGPPNEMQCGPYDVHCDETAVVEQVDRLTARVAELEKVLRAIADHERRAGCASWFAGSTAYAALEHKHD